MTSITERQRLLCRLAGQLAEPGNVTFESLFQDLNRLLAEQGHPPANWAELTTALERSQRALKERMRRNRSEMAAMTAVSQVAVDLGAAGDDPIGEVLERAGFPSERLHTAPLGPTVEEKRLLEAVAREELALLHEGQPPDPDAQVSFAAKALLARSRTDPALGAAVVALTLRYAADDARVSLELERERDEEHEPPGTLRVRAVLDLVRDLAPAAVQDMALARLDRHVERILAEKGVCSATAEAVVTQVKADPRLADAAVREYLTQFLEEKIALEGLAA